LRLKAGISYTRHSPSNLKALVGATPTATADGGLFSALTASIGGRYYVRRLSFLQPFGTISVGLARTKIERIRVENGQFTRRIEASVELSPWVEAGIGARRKVAPNVHVSLGPAVSVIFTEADPTYRMSIDAGVQYSF
jgi:hypothetical protein